MGSAAAMPEMGVMTPGVVVVVVVVVERIVAAGTAIADDK